MKDIFLIMIIILACIVVFIASYNVVQYFIAKGHESSEDLEKRLLLVTISGFLAVATVAIMVVICMYYRYMHIVIEEV